MTATVVGIVNVGLVFEDLDEAPAVVGIDPDRQGRVREGRVDDPPGACRLDRGASSRGGGWLGSVMGLLPNAGRRT